MARKKAPTGKPKTGRPTLQTIADRLRVSRTTVSNAYSRPDQLNPELRQMIFDVARDIGYTGPDPAARTLRRGRSNTIGVLFTEALTFAFSDPAAVQLLQGLAEVCDATDYSVLLLPFPPGADYQPSVVRNAVVDAFLVYCKPEGDPMMQAVLDRGLPTVIVDETRHPQAAFVGIDDRAGARAVAEHLLGLGHRRFAVVTDRLHPDNYAGPADLERQATATFGINRERLRGYAEAMHAYGLHWDDVIVQECFPISPEAGHRGAAALLDRAERPTAILATSDQLALGVLRAAGERGIVVPDALSVAGFDDIESAALTHPGLTTVRQPLLEKGRAAGRLLTNPWPRGDPPSIILPTELVVRGSTGPAPP